MKNYKVWVSFLIVLLIWISGWTLFDTLIDKYKITNDNVIMICILVLFISISFAYHSDYIGLN